MDVVSLLNGLKDTAIPLSCSSSTTSQFPVASIERTEEAKAVS